MLENFETEFPEHTPRTDGAPHPLDGTLVVDFSHFIAGPLATMILADMGAQVVKVEAPARGDDLRRYPPMHPQLDQGAPFLWSNRNKQSVALDLKSPEGIELVRQLIRKADVLVENFSSGVMGRLGLDYETCRALNPRLVYCSVAAYSREGKFADRLGFDPIAQAESGFVSMNGYADRDGVRALSPVMDISTAMMVSNAVLGALLARERLGTGQRVEVSLFDTAVLMTGYASMQSLFTGSDPKRSGNTSPDTCPSGAFHAKDRTFYINSGNDNIFQRLMIQVLERPDLAAHADYASGPLRSKHRERLFGVLNDAFGKEEWSLWQGRMRAAGVPCGLVRTVGEAIRSPEARDHELVTRIPHPVLGSVPNVRLPIRYATTPLADPVAAPCVGQHTREVLKTVLGMNENVIDAAAKAGAFGLAPTN
ncbi:Succinyl-CoA:(R)-benzylsuccinate CoA-transferase subunit BbsF [Variovorax sp. SRS16]|uniref:CaiB/BaiF CoA transferase family protein n=1 Tax=Variovorax sp. SRS16 TaxID=282217 RepID=UPI00131911E7|nr:CoA transferase [Variovorax sp. SRS16]VTU20585.1 Succinyl-CoA:(R)-benzylsuccinate CoA-transferase subunit BbsF [Variovorax sp. SRS16]